MGVNSRGLFAFPWCESFIADHIDQDRECVGWNPWNLVANDGILKSTSFQFHLPCWSPHASIAPGEGHIVDHRVSRESSIVNWIQSLCIPQNQLLLNNSGSKRHRLLLPLYFVLDRSFHFQQARISSRVCVSHRICTEIDPIWSREPLFDLLFYLLFKMPDVRTDRSLTIYQLTWSR